MYRTRCLQVKRENTEFGTCFEIYNISTCLHCSKIKLLLGHRFDKKLTNNVQKEIEFAECWPNVGQYVIKIQIKRM